MPAPAPSELTFYSKWGDLCEKGDWCGLVLRSAYFSASPYPLPRSLVLYLIRYASDPSSAQGSTVHATLAPLPLSSMFLLPVSVPALCGRCGASAAVLLFRLDLLRQQSTAMTATRPHLQEREGSSVLALDLFQLLPLWISPRPSGSIATTVPKSTLVIISPALQYAFHIFPSAVISLI